MSPRAAGAGKADAPLVSEGDFADTAIFSLLKEMSGLSRLCDGLDRSLKNKKIGRGKHQDEENAAMDQFTDAADMILRSIAATPLDAFAQLAIAYEYVRSYDLKIMRNGFLLEEEVVAGLRSAALFLKPWACSHDGTAAFIRSTYLQPLPGEAVAPADPALFIYEAWIKAEARHATYSETVFSPAEAAAISARGDPARRAEAEKKLAPIERRYNLLVDEAAAFIGKLAATPATSLLGVKRKLSVAVESERYDDLAQSALRDFERMMPGSLAMPAGAGVKKRRVAPKRKAAKAA